MRLSGHQYMTGASDEAEIIGLTNKTRETKNIKHDVFISPFLLSYGRKVEIFLTSTHS